VKVLELIDNFLSGNLVHIYGDAKCGKTHLAVYHAVIEAYRRAEIESDKECKLRFIVIDCDGGTSVSRLLEIARANGVNADELYKRLEVFKPNSFNEAYKLVTSDLPQWLRVNQYEAKAICLDGLMLLYRREWVDVPKKQILEIARQLKPRLNAILTSLLYTARQYDAIATVTNIKKSFLGFEGVSRETRLDFYGGMDFAYIPYATLRVDRLEDNKFIASLVMHRFKKAGDTAIYTIAKEGVKDATL